MELIPPCLGDDIPPHVQARPFSHATSTPLGRMVCGGDIEERRIGILELQPFLPCLLLHEVSVVVAEPVRLPCHQSTSLYARDLSRFRLRRLTDDSRPSILLFLWKRGPYRDAPQQRHNRQ
jgi:hypothetical protein